LSFSSPNDELCCGANLRQLNAHVGQHTSGDALNLVHQAEQEVLGSDVRVIETPGLFLRKRKHLSSTRSEFFEVACHGASPIARGSDEQAAAVAGCTGRQIR
jgi:hypothetical protein